MYSIHNKTVAYSSTITSALWLDYQASVTAEMSQNHGCIYGK